MVPTNALQRTFHLGYGEIAGTCFTIDVGGRQYLVTAKHLLEVEGTPWTVQLHHGGEWKDLRCELVGLAADEVDIAVLAPPHVVSPAHEFVASTSDLFLGQDAYLLGFPLKLRADVGALNRDFPLPLVKRACVSLMSLVGPGPLHVLLDGHNNDGFSGGPVVFAPEGKGIVKNVAAVISGYREYLTPVLACDGKTKTGHWVAENTGLVEAYSIDYALELIASNPIGAAL